MAALQRAMAALQSNVFFSGIEVIELPDHKAQITQAQARMPLPLPLALPLARGDLGPGPDSRPDP